MLSKNIVSEVLAKCLVTGGDFAEIFEEDSINNSISLVDGKVDDAIGGRIYGIGIRIFKGLNSVYAYTNNNNLNSLLETAYRAALALGDVKGEAGNSIVLNEKSITTIHPIIYYPKAVAYDRKIAILKSAYNGAKNFNNEISQVIANYGDKEQNVLIANTEGLYVQDTRIRTRLGVSAIASKGNENQTGFEGPGRHTGIEMFESVNPEYHGREAARVAHTMLHAKNCPAGNMTVAIDNGFGGVIFHEACGHSLEASAVAKGNSVFANKLGEQIASTKVTAIDDGTVPNAWGSLNIDDEGHKTQKNILIENGILKGYMIDKLNGRRMNMESTGSSRRQSYKFQPTSRMTNTYIAAGDDNTDDIIKSIEDGLYAKKLGGGSVNPVTGEFNFAVQEGYLVKNGVIQEPVRGASLIGKGSQVLMDIDMVGNNLDVGQGMCGSSSGSIPTNVGQPMIRVKKMTVGGR
ncbi:TldD/PmbA family protein [Clostridium chromiireducens]|uniref:Metalloprotease TldD n=1 Tax=Clostridium chromiireducens TaxID=225345 RepID=A0A1V4IA06_9CLOT|nr:TldD/PmbA family protein [Clostridium chromiireducens]OPJ56710.1 metalloprotease TldD [Clostridium chromiireducens]RII32370.1 TldD/PmbA family protein [Clostridium chromiireducens]